MEDSTPSEEQQAYKFVKGLSHQYETLIDNIQSGLVEMPKTVAAVYSLAANCKLRTKDSSNEKMIMVARKQIQNEHKNKFKNEKFNNKNNSNNNNNKNNNDHSGGNKKSLNQNEYGGRKGNAILATYRGTTHMSAKRLSMSTGNRSTEVRAIPNLYSNQVWFPMLILLM
jgi:hypothetical protein